MSADLRAPPEASRTVTCFNCAKSGHKLAQCPEPLRSGGRFQVAGERASVLGQAASSGGGDSQRPHGAPHRGDASAHRPNGGTQSQRSAQVGRALQDRTRSSLRAAPSAASAADSAVVTAAPPTTRGACFNCGQVGHRASGCPSRDLAPLTLRSAGAPEVAPAFSAVLVSTSGVQGGLKASARHLLVNARAGDTPVVLFLDNGADCGIVAAGTLARVLHHPFTEIALDPPAVRSIAGLGRDVPGGPIASIGSIAIAFEVAYYVRQDRALLVADETVRGVQLVRFEVVASDDLLGFLSSEPGKHVFLVGSDALRGNRDGILARIISEAHSPQYELVLRPVAPQAICDGAVPDQQSRGSKNVAEQPFRDLQTTASESRDEAAPPLLLRTAEQVAEATCRWGGASTDHWCRASAAAAEEKGVGAESMPAPASPRRAAGYPCAARPSGHQAPCGRPEHRV